MIKKLTKHGNSLALVIDKGVLSLLNIDDETALDITTDGKVLTISPIHDETERKKKFEKALEKTNKKYGRALKKLSE